MERVRQEKRAEQEKRSTAETEWRKRAKEGINLRWMRTAPKSAKKHVSKVSAEDSVAAVAVVRAFQRNEYVIERPNRGVMMA